MTREDLIHAWRMRRIDEAIDSYRLTVEQLERDFYRLTAALHEATWRPRLEVIDGRLPWTRTQR